MQETRTHVPDYILTLKLASDAPWDKEEGTEKQTEGEYEIEGKICSVVFTLLFMDTKFKDYILLAPNCKGYDGYFIVIQLLKKKNWQMIPQSGKHVHRDKQLEYIQFIDSLNFCLLNSVVVPMLWKLSAANVISSFFSAVLKTKITQPLFQLEYYGVDSIMFWGEIAILGMVHS